MAENKKLVPKLLQEGLWRKVIILIGQEKDELFDWTKGKRIAVAERVAVEKYSGRELIAVEPGKK